MKHRWGKLDTISLYEAVEIGMTYRMRRGTLVTSLSLYEPEGFLIDRRRRRRLWRKLWREVLSGKTARRTREDPMQTLRRLRRIYQAPRLLLY